MKNWGANALYLGPVFESDCHGYDTRDYRTVDCRLGENGDLKQVVEEFHARGIKVILDGVFNHVGRGFWAFRDVQEKKWDSPYKDWFTSILTEIPAMTTVFGMRAGRGILSW